MSDSLKCKVCGVETNQICARCKSVRYCSKEHMRQDWQSHKRGCQKPKAHPTPSAEPSIVLATDLLSAPLLTEYPSSKNGKAAAKLKTVQAVLFPVDEDKPRLLDVEYTTRPSQSNPNVKEHLLYLLPWFKGPRDDPTPYTVYRANGFDGPPLGRTLQMFFNDNFMATKDPLNQCIQKIVPGGPGHDWCGHVLVLRAKEPGPVGNCLQYYDATLEDVEPMINCWKDYGRREDKEQQAWLKQNGFTTFDMDSLKFRK
ncbi:hypothetical protein C8Q75DRAFT_736789 [Abortiporus biennis]|nr:hypothetical protein C8Q75DRAFT_736789 [Abortiporus biennis]